jgi:hydroxylaminobenzene mutase
MRPTKGFDVAEDNAKRSLIWHGLVLFFLGLLTGFVVPSMTSPRLGISAHMEAVMNGMFLILVGGVVWDLLGLSRRIATAVYWLLLCSAYGNWLFCLLAAVFGASKMLPVAGAGHHALPWQEWLITLGLGLVAISITLACGFMVYAARKGLAKGRAV